MSAKEYLEELDRRYRFLSVQNANGFKTREEALEFVKLVEGRRRTGKEAPHKPKRV